MLRIGDLDRIDFGDVVNVTRFARVQHFPARLLEGLKGKINLRLKDQDEYVRTNVISFLEFV